MTYVINTKSFENLRLSMEHVKQLIFYMKL